MRTGLEHLEIDNVNAIECQEALYLCFISIGIDLPAFLLHKRLKYGTK